jgi:ATP-dependent helicase Lhr and Lhr-like helicase
LGRTGRRPGSTPNCLFLCLDDESVLHALGMLQRWADGWVEPAEPPPHPRHIAAQQLMALCLQEHRIGERTWREWWGDLPVFDDSAEEILGHLVEQGYFERDGPFLHIGPEAERRFGRRYFSDLTAVFSAPPEFTVLAGRSEIGTIGTDVLSDEVNETRFLLLGGRSWKITHIDWDRRSCFVEAAEGGGRAKWSGTAGSVSYEVARGMRQVVLGTSPNGISLTSRTERIIEELRESYRDRVSSDAFVVRLPSGSPGRWWTWAGTTANRSLRASLPGVVDPRQRVDEKSLRLLPGVGVREFSTALRDIRWRNPLADMNALNGLKFSTALPTSLAQQTLGARLGNESVAQSVAAEKKTIHR